MASSPDTLPDDPIRAQVDEWLSGIGAVKDGDSSVFFIEIPIDGRSVAVTPENAAGCENSIRTTFGKEYPDLLAN